MPHGVLIRVLLALLLAAMVSAVHAEAPACTPATKTERIGNGTLVYNIVGAGPSVLLIHGLFANKEQWTALACRLADAGHTAIAIDLPGYGKSSGYGLADYRLERPFSVAGAPILQRRIAGSVVHRLPNAGHLLPVENSAEVAPIYVEFLRAK